ncbi:MAG: hypothetical protein EBV06_00245 [Planctomycetia bacterium]|nr:hypothetical protein [Planctomycetia bacterium]
MQLVPNRFLFRISQPCRYIADLPTDDEDLFVLPDSCRIQHFAALDAQVSFADVRMAWNENGLAVQVEVRGKEQPAVGDASRPRQSDGFSLWIDTRDSRTSHRASRFCHQFHFLPTGAGPDRDEAAFVQVKIHRALVDAPLVEMVPLRVKKRAGGYRLTAWLPSTALAGYDPEQSPRMGLFWVMRDNELGEQASGATENLPYAEDPTLWGVLELVR